MLAQAYRDVLVQATVEVLLHQLNFEQFVDGVQPGTSATVIPRGPGANYKGAVTAVVDAADAQNWLRALVNRLATQFPARPEFAIVIAEIDRVAPIVTIANPFEEVLLEGERPFANRRPLRAHLLDLTNAGGSCVLSINGESQSGKSWSFHLINHVGNRKGFIVSKFKVGVTPKPDKLADEILRRIGAPATLPGMGDESAERWAEQLADLIATPLLDRQIRRLFVFDEFPDATLPLGTPSLIRRLATYADQELRPFLRVVLMRFGSSLSSDVEDIALHDVAEPFTATDMVALVMQVVKARQWALTEAVAKQRIDQFLQGTDRTLRERSNFLRDMLRKMASGTP